jgi:hypothetical protein
MDGRRRAQHVQRNAPPPRPGRLGHGWLRM